MKRSTLAIGLAVLFTFCMIIGYTGGAMGIGSLYPPLNFVAGPFVCPGADMSYAQHTMSVGSETYFTAEWFCGDRETGKKTEVSEDTVFLIAGPVYGFVFFIVAIVIVLRYWSSGVGPLKNDGLRLW